MFNRFKTGKVIAFGAMLVGLNVATAHAGMQDFEFVNLNNQASIVQAWVAAAGTDEPWKTISIYTPIAPRATSPITLSGYQGCMFDLKVSFSDGYQQSFSNVNLCTVKHIVAS
jgi:hypothetical protein